LASNVFGRGFNSRRLHHFIFCDERMNKSRYHLEKFVNKKSKEFPAGTVIFYGPTADFASKVVVSVFLSGARWAESA